jgi:hypothetical protein
MRMDAEFGLRPQSDWHHGMPGARAADDRA